VVPILFRGVCLRDNKEDNEKKRKQDEKRLEIQCMIHFLFLYLVDYWALLWPELDMNTYIRIIYFCL